MPEGPHFANHRQQLFGREADLQYLLERAQLPGLTAVVGRPLMGKSWLLNEVGRCLEDGGPDRRWCVGYYESSGEAPLLREYEAQGTQEYAEALAKLIHGLEDGAGDYRSSLKRRLRKLAYDQPGESRLQVTWREAELYA